MEGVGQGAERELPVRPMPTVQDDINDGLADRQGVQSGYQH